METPARKEAEGDRGNTTNELRVVLWLLWKQTGRSEEEKWEFVIRDGEKKMDDGRISVILGLTISRRDGQFEALDYYVHDGGGLVWPMRSRHWLAHNHVAMAVHPSGHSFNHFLEKKKLIDYRGISVDAILYAYKPAR